MWSKWLAVQVGLEVLGNQEGHSFCILLFFFRKPQNVYMQLIFNWQVGNSTSTGNAVCVYVDEDQQPKARSFF